MRLFLMVALAAVLGLVSAGAGRAETPTPARGEIRGVVFHDRNANGVRDAGEEGLQSRTVTVERDGATAGTTGTDSNGEYVFSGIAPGEYTVLVDVDGGQGICSSGVATFNPFPYTYCVSATVPWHATSPVPLRVTVNDAAGAIADFGARPADVAVLEGLALLEDDYAAPGTLIEAVVNGQVCGSATMPSREGYFIGDRRFELHVLGAAEQPGCATRGDSVAFRVGGVPAAESSSWLSFSDLTTFAQFQFISLTAIQQHAWYWYEQSEGDLPAVGTLVQDVIGGVICGEAHIESQGTGLSGFSKLLVPSEEIQPDCGRPGAIVLFLFDGVPTGDSSEWRPGLQRVDLPAGPVILPSDGSGPDRGASLWAAIALLLAGGSLLTGAGRLAARRRS